PTDVARLVAAYPGMRHDVWERLFIRKIPWKPAICAKWTQWTEEVEMLRSLQSPPFPHHKSHIIPIIDTIKCSDESIFIVMPHYTPLYVAHYRDLIGVGEYKDLRHQLVEGVAFLHSRDVAHCDIKPDNLVVQNPERPLGTLYIIDFDSAVSCASTKLQCGFRGTEGWTAPEVRDGNRWDPKKADIWALGTVLTHFAHGLSVNNDVVKDCLSVDPSTRPSATQLLDRLMERRLSLLGKRTRTEMESPSQDP
ncbi:hypothetical protein FRB99_006945, partial [Tulasnella sp. 403]